MKFGLFFQTPEAPGQSHGERFAEMLDLIGLADTLGFDVAWLAELHFGGAFSLLASPLMAVPVIAQRTRRIRIGTAVTLLPLHHPLACAEQAATADLLSGGRLECGVGRGSIPSQFHGFRVPVSENRGRFGEALDIIRLAWTRERFSYDGTYYQGEDVSVGPRRLTTPTPLPHLREFMATYRARLHEAGHPWQPDQMALMLPVHIGDTSAAARDAMRPGVRQYYENLRTIVSAVPDSYAEHLPRLKIIEDTLGNLPYEKFCRDQAVFGDVAEVIDRLQAAVEEFGLSQVICWFDQGSMLPRAEVERTMRRFAEQVMPKL